MIVPSTRLLLVTALLVVPFTAFFGAVPEYAAVSAAVLLLVLTVVIVDAALAFGGLAGLRLEAPEVMRLTKEHSTVLPLKLVLTGRPPRALRLGLPLPETFHTDSRERVVQFADGASRAVVDWPLQALRRGVFRLEQCFGECGSPLGLWLFRSEFALNVELRVYPNLRVERRNLAALFLNRGAFGIHAQRQVGKGRDFEKLRAYAHGDSVEDIHWKATAKRNSPVTKVFQIERTQEVYVVIDSSRLSARTVPSPGAADDAEFGGGTAVVPGMTVAPSPEVTELERFINAALVMGMVAEKQGDLFGVMAFSDTVRQFVRARNGRAHYAACRDALFALQPSEATPDFNEVCSFIRLRLRRRALVLFLTNLDDPVHAETFIKNVRLISSHHLVIVNMLRPATSRPLFTEPEKVQRVDDIYAELGSHLQWQTLREVESTLRKHGVAFHQLDNVRMSAELVSQYLRVKQRQLI